MDRGAGDDAHRCAVSLAVSAWADLAERPAEQVNGPKASVGSDHRRQLRRPDPLLHPRSPPSVLTPRSKLNTERLLTIDAIAGTSKGCSHHLCDTLRLPSTWLGHRDAAVSLSSGSG
jgi:hypothetical protein